MAPGAPPDALFALLSMVVLLLVLDGVGIQAGWSVFFGLGVPVSRGRCRLAVPIDAGAGLPQDPTGALGVWLGPSRVGWWSGAIRFGFKGGRRIRALRGMGVMFTRTAALQADRQSVEWVVRVRVAPMLLVLGVCALAVVQFGALGGGAGLPFALLCCLFFSAFYGLFAWLALGHTHRARAVVLGPDAG